MPSEPAGEAEQVVAHIARRKREMDRLARIAGRAQGVPHAALRRAGRLSVHVDDAVAALHDAEHASRRRLLVLALGAMVLLIVLIFVVAATLH